MHGPKPRNESPALGANEHGANRKSKSKRHSNRPSKPKSKAIHRFAVTDGFYAAGHVIEYVGLQFKATDPNGKTIGIFKSLKKAMAAIPPAPTHGGGHA